MESSAEIRVPFRASRRTDGFGGVRPRQLLVRRCPSPEIFRRGRGAPGSPEPLGTEGPPGPSARFPSSLPSPPVRDVRSTASRGRRLVLRVCTFGVHTGCVSPRWLSWGLCRRCLRPDRRFTTPGPRTGPSPSSAPRGGSLLRSGRPSLSTRRHLRDAFQSIHSGPDGYRFPGPCPPAVARRTLQRPPRSTSGLRSPDSEPTEVLEGPLRWLS